MPKALRGAFLSQYEAVRIVAGCMFATWKYVPMRPLRALQRRHCQRYRQTAPLKGVRRPFMPDGAAYTRPANRRGSVAAYSELVVKTQGYKAGTPAKSIYLPG